MRPGRSVRVREAGYSLVELMVVLLLLSFITLAISGGLHFGTRIWEASEQAVADADHTGEAQSVLREILGSAVPAHNGEYVDFDGTPYRIEFRGIAPQSAGIAGLVRFQVLADRREQAASLRVRIVKAAKADKDHEVSLITGTTLLRFAYLDSSESVPSWLDRWRDRNRLPDAIRIEGVDDASRAAWPVLIVRLAIAQTPLCSFDPVSSDCRNSGT